MTVWAALMRWAFFPFLYGCMCFNAYWCSYACAHLMERLHGGTTILRHRLLSPAGLHRVQRVTRKGWVASTTHDISHTTLPAMFRGRNCNSCEIAWTAFMVFSRHHHGALCGAIDRITSRYRRYVVPRDEKPLEGCKSLRNAYLEWFNAVN